VPDARTAALAAMMLEGLDVAVTRHDPAAAPGAPDADLWVAHEPSARDVESFISRDACRRAVVLGGPSWAGCGAADARVSVVPKAAPPSILRDALSAAVGTLSSLNAKSEANRS
jgi:hypothetical protein